MKTFEDPATNEIKQYLAPLAEIPQRDPLKAEAARQRYLAQLEQLCPLEAQTSVTTGLTARIQTWWSNFVAANPFQLRKERTTMTTTFMILITVITLLFGGTGLTVNAAQDSLPGQALYALKLNGEDLRLELTQAPEARMDALGAFIASRVQEALALAQQGQELPEGLLLRLQNQFNLALQLAAGQDDEKVQPMLEQLRARLENQERQVISWQLENPGLGEASMNQVRSMLRDRIQLTDDCLADPDLLRQMIQDRDRLQDRDCLQDCDPDQVRDRLQDRDCLQDCDPDQDRDRIQDRDRLNITEQTPEPAQSQYRYEYQYRYQYLTGTPPCVDCTPVQDGSGPGPGPNAGNSYGDPSATCTPVQDGTGPGPGPGAGDSNGAPDPQSTPQPNPNPGGGEPNPKGKP